MIIKSVGVLSVGKVMGLLYAALGLIFGGIFSFVALLAAGAAAGGPGGPGGPGAGAFMFGFGVGAIIFLPIMYGIIGFIAGLIMAALYNLIASTLGGIEIELSRERRDDYE